MDIFLASSGYRKGLGIGVLEKLGEAFYIHRALQKRAAKGIEAVEYLSKVADTFDGIRGTRDQSEVFNTQPSAAKTPIGMRSVSETQSGRVQRRSPVVGDIEQR